MSQIEEDSPKNPFFSLISKFLPKPQQVKNESVNLITEEEEGSRSNLSPDVVRLPVHTRPEVSPLKLEVEEAERGDTNPFVLWQVYALGGFIIMKWAWAKWQERKANSKDGSSDEEQPSPPDS